jgi:hypothetical protein
MRKSVSAENTFSSDLSDFDDSAAELEPLADKFLDLLRERSHVQEHRVVRGRLMAQQKDALLVQASSQAWRFRPRCRRPDAHLGGTGDPSGFLDSISDRAALGVEWLRTPHNAVMFGGLPPLDLVISGSQDGLLSVRRFLDGARRGLYM